VLDSQEEVLHGFNTIAGIERYLDALVDVQVTQENPTGCPIATLAGQLADRDERTRLILADGLARWEQGLRERLEAMAQRGELRADADPGLLANQTLAILQGGLLLAHIRRDPGQMRIAADTVLAVVKAALA
jgi:hypothetical protein